MGVREEMKKRRPTKVAERVTVLVMNRITQFYYFQSILFSTQFHYCQIMAKSSNPADAHRKQLRKKELKKNKDDRKKTREISTVKKDTRR